MAEVFLDLGPEGGQAPVVDHVLEPGPFAVGAVAEVAEDLDDGLADREQVVAVDVAERHARGTGTSSGARGRAQAAADQDVVADELAALDHGQEAQVVGVDVGAVVFRQGERRLELARQVGLAVDRLDGVVAGGRRPGSGPGAGNSGLSIFSPSSQMSQ